MIATRALCASLLLCVPRTSAADDADPAEVARAAVHLRAAARLIATGHAQEGLAQARAGQRAVAGLASTDARAREALCRLLSVELEAGIARDDATVAAALELCPALAGPSPIFAPGRSSPAATHAASAAHVVRISLPREQSAAEEAMHLGEFEKASGMLAGKNAELARLLADASRQLDERPSLAVAPLEGAMRILDPEAADGIVRMRDHLAGKRSRAAALVAARVATLFEASIASLALRLPAALLAEDLHLRAAALSARGDAGGALALYDDAHEIDPAFTERVGQWRTAHEARFRHLRARALACEGDHLPELAYAYWLAVDHLAGHAQDVAQHLALLRPAMRAAIATRLVLRDASASTSPNVRVVRRAIEVALARGLPEHIAVADRDGEELVLEVDPPRRNFTGAIETRAVQLAPYEAPVANPAWAAAARAYNDAISELAAARRSVAESRAAMSRASSVGSSLVGQFFGGAASAVSSTLRATQAVGEAAGAARLSSAESKMRRAGDRLRGMPRIIVEPITVAAEYPVVAVEAHATVDCRARYRQHDRSWAFSAVAHMEEIPASPELGVRPQAGDRARLARLEPDLGPDAAKIADDVVGMIHGASDEALWQAAKAAQASGSVEQSVVAMARYRYGASAKAAHRTEALLYVTRRLP